MKKASAAIISLLNSSSVFYRCELYEITLKNGTVMRYTNYQTPISLSDGRIFRVGPVFKRGNMELASTISVDSIAITMLVDETDVVGGASLMTVARNGGFDEAYCSVIKCFLSADGAVVGTVAWFNGILDVKDGGGMEISLENKSMAQKANIDYPMRLYYPNCPYALFSAGCGLNINDWTVEGTVTQVNSQSLFCTNLSFADGYYDVGDIEFTSGDLTGTSMTVKNSYAASGQLKMLVAFDSLPAVGDKFKIRPGCPKTPAVCASRFGNWARNRATPYIPLKETVM